MDSINGTHLLIDGYVKNETKLERETVLKLFDALVESLRLQYLTEPTAMDVPLRPERLETDEDDGGTSYWAQITTSHISMHAWPLRKAFMFDILSCKPFDPFEAIQTVWKFLDVDKATTNVIQREDPKRLDKELGLA